ncbi:MAG: hypothetical protein IH600_16450 [Bacteroidetes bacterium]|nr:hypothetical protein [Bacteroidota bacterium]
MTSMFDHDDVGPALNTSHIVLTVNGMRPDLPSGWIKRTVVETETEYGKRVDTVYEYPDGTKIIR